jgi:putative ABC transport system ATP-binding protein
MSGIRLEVRHLSLNRAGQRVLSDVSLQLDTGEIVCLLGPSGSGKSSLLRCLNVLTEPPAGNVLLDGQDVTGLPVINLRSRVGMLFQQASLFQGTVAQNVAYGPALQGRELSRSEILVLLTQVDLQPDMAERPASLLSGGQAQRVALARTLANQPDVLLLDEPTSALDPSASRRIEETVLQLRETLGLAVLWVTHDVEQARRVASRVYLLVEGRIVDEGSAEHLLRPGSHHLTATFAAGELANARTEPDI